MPEKKFDKKFNMYSKVYGVQTCQKSHKSWIKMDFIYTTLKKKKKKYFSPF